MKNKNEKNPTYEEKDENGSQESIVEKNKEEKAGFLEVFFDSLNDVDRDKIEGCLTELKPVFDQVDLIEEIEGKLESERDHVANLQSKVARLEEEKVYWKSKASDYGDAAGNADRAHLRRASAQALAMLSKIGRPSGAKARLAVQQNVNHLNTAKKILSDALVGNRRRINVDRKKKDESKAGDKQT